MGGGGDVPVVLVDGLRVVVLLLDVLGHVAGGHQGHVASHGRTSKCFFFFFFFNGKIMRFLSSRSFKRNGNF